MDLLKICVSLLSTKTLLVQTCHINTPHLYLTSLSTEPPLDGWLTWTWLVHGSVQVSHKLMHVHMAKPIHVACNITMWHDAAHVVVRRKISWPLGHKEPSGSTNTHGTNWNRSQSSWIDFSLQWTHVVFIS